MNIISQNEEHKSTKRKIIEATMNIISTDGFCKVTVRKVASQAGVNVAAINYHFGTKEQLINEALLNITEQLKSSFAVLRREELKPVDRLKIFLNNYVKTMMRYPDIINNFIMQSITDCHISGEYESFIKENGYELIKNALRQIRPEDNEKVLDMRIMQMLGGLAFPILVANRNIALQDFDYYHEEVRSQYVDIMIDNMCLQHYGSESHQ